MSVKNTVKKQYQVIINEAAQTPLRSVTPPAEGWITSLRKALGMSTTQLGQAVQRTRANISAAERSERNERATLKSMKTLAEAMGCKFVYGIVPLEGSVQDLIDNQARKKAKAIVEQANTHMALEKQSISNTKIEAEITRVAQELMSKPPSDFWADE